MSITILPHKFKVHKDYTTNDFENNNIAMILDWIIPGKYSGFSFNTFTLELRVFLLEEIETETLNFLRDTLLSGDTSLPVISFSKVKNMVRQTIHYGNDLILDFATENTVLGITQLGLTSHILRVTAPILSAIQTGAFHVAIEEIRKIPVQELDNKILTPDRLKKFRNKIEAFLEIPLAKEWNQ
jgi:hypothetical protein